MPATLKFAGDCSYCKKHIAIHYDEGVWSGYSIYCSTQCRTLDGEGANEDLFQEVCSYCKKFIGTNVDNAFSDITPYCSYQCYQRGEA